MPAVKKVIGLIRCSGRTGETKREQDGLPSLSAGEVGDHCMVTDQPFVSKCIDVVVQRMQKYTERRTFHTPKLPTIRPGYGTAKLKAR